MSNLCTRWKAISRMMSLTILVTLFTADSLIGVSRSRAEWMLLTAGVMVLSGVGVIRPIWGSGMGRRDVRGGLSRRCVPD
jgi:hypothetical protein